MSAERYAVIDNPTDDNFPTASIAQIHNDSNTSASTAANIVSEESTVQSRGRCLKLQSDMGAQESLSSTGIPKRARTQTPRFKRAFIYKWGQRLFKSRLNEISNRQLLRTVGTQIDSSRPAKTELNAEVEGAKNSIKSRIDLNDAVCPTKCPSPHARLALNRNRVWHSQTRRSRK
jgi:hypothetical protein